MRILAPAAACAVAAVALAAGAPRAPTFHGQVDRILRKHCDECHHPGDIGPEAFDDAANAKKWADQIVAEIDAGRMPPWRPTRGVGRFVDERGLTTKEIATIRRWRDAGAPEGRPTPQKATEYPDGWLLGEPDAVLDYGEPFTVEPGGDDVYRCFPIKNPFGRDVWLSGIDVRPGDRRVLHHVVMYVDSTGDSAALDAADPGPGYACFGGPGTSSPTVLGGWAPGNRPRFFPDGTAMLLRAGDTVVMQCHYHAANLTASVDDRTTIGLYVSPAADPQPIYLVPVINTSFTIPAGNAAYPVEAVLDPSAMTGGLIKVSGHVLGVLPHMHLLGKSIAVDMLLPDATEQRLVEIRDWSFDWQDTYVFERAVPIPPGATFRVRAVYDDSSANPSNPNSPPRDVSYGESTTDEMCLAFLEATIGPATADAPPVVRRARFDRAGRLVVSAKGLGVGGRIEVDGEPIDTAAAGRNVLRSAADVATHWTAGVPASIRVRRTDGRLSAPMTFVR
jgi:hypothetical protein